MAMLKGLIIFMGVLIVAGVGVVGVTIYNRATKPKVEPTEVTTSVPVAPAAQSAPPPTTSPAPQTSARGAAFGSAVLNVGQSCEIAETRADGDRLIVRTEGPGACRRIHVVDLVTGATLGTLDVLPAR